MAIPNQFIYAMTEVLVAASDGLSIFKGLDKPSKNYNRLRPMAAPAIKGKRNSPCPCGSKKKFKHCCNSPKTA